jgi:hypothetical protein
VTFGAEVATDPVEELARRGGSLSQQRAQLEQEDERGD